MSEVTQRVGLTDITNRFSTRRCGGGRELFGKVVPYGDGWRGGRGTENTTISFTDDAPRSKAIHLRQAPTGCT